MSGNDLTLLEGLDYVLRTNGRDGRRFLGLFRRCVDLIPEADRRTILDYWGRRGMGKPASFELSDLPESHAQVAKGSCGYHLRFDAYSFQIMPEQPALYIIAHELAHVHGWASGKTEALIESILDANRNLALDLDEVDFDKVVLDRFEPENEATAHTLAVEWKFDKVARDRLHRLTGAIGFETACSIMAKGEFT